MRCRYDGGAVRATGTLCVSEEVPRGSLSEEVSGVAHGALRRGGDASSFEARTVWRVSAKVASSDPCVRAIAQVVHPFAPMVVSSRGDAERWWYVLAQRFDSSLAQHPRAPLDRAIPWLLSMLSAAKIMVEQGVDCARIAPSSVLLSDVADPFVCLLPTHLRLDGLEKNPIVNEPYCQYVSPESFGQSGARSRDAMDRAAQYAIGAVMFEVLTGEAPFALNGMATYVEKQQREAASARSLRKDVSEALDRVIAQMLARVPDERFRSLSECCDAAVDACGAELAEADAREDVRGALARLARPDLRRFARVQRRADWSANDPPAALWERLFSSGVISERWLDGGRRLFGASRCKACVNKSRDERCAPCNNARWTEWLAYPSQPADALAFASCASDVESAEALARLIGTAWGLDSSVVAGPIRWEPVTSESVPSFGMWALRLTSDRPLNVLPMDAAALSVAPMWWQRVASVVDDRTAEFAGWVKDGVSVPASEWYPRWMQGQPARSVRADNPWDALAALLALGFVLCSARADGIVLGYRSLALRSIHDG